MNLIKQLWFGFLLIGLTASVLLIADLDKRNSGSKNERSAHHSNKRIAILQLSTRPLIDDTRSGILSGLRKAGYVEGENLEIVVYNAEGDLATAANMAKAITDGAFDATFSISTPCLQAMANANKKGSLPHIFCAVTDPYGAGVGISRKDHLDHPEHMTGIGTFQPVETALAYAQQMNPKLKRIGTVWNPSETNSEACVKKARSYCAENGLDLIEANATNSIEVGESTRALIARGVDAIWIGGDNVVELAAGSIIKLAKDAGIPAFANAPIHAKEGCLFGVGANYFQVGLEAAKIGTKILNGANPKSFSVENFAPPQLALNLPALKHLDEQWNIPESLKEKAIAFVDQNNKWVKKQNADSSSEKVKVAVLNLVSQHILDLMQQGVMDALKENGFNQHNINLKVYNPEGDISILPSMCQSIIQDEYDLVITLTTPCLQAFANANKKAQLKHVFCGVTDPFSAGVGLNKDTPFEHPSWMIGAGTKNDVRGGIEKILKLVPDAKKIGTVWNASEANSEALTIEARKVCKELGLELLEANADRTIDVPIAGQSLIDRGIDAMWAGSDNTVETAMDVFAQTCLKNKIPLVSGGYETADQGVLMCYGPRTYEVGGYGGEIAAQVLKGIEISKAPIVNFTPSKLILNEKTAQAIGLQFPRDLYKTAQEVIRIDGEKKKLNPMKSVTPPIKTYDIAYMIYTEAQTCESFEEGFLEEMDAMGWIPDVHYKFKKNSAQGDLSILPVIARTINENPPDVLVTNSTPTLQAASVEIDTIPIVGSVISSPILAGVAETMEKHRANITGIHTMSDFKKMVEVIKTCFPDAKKVGTIFTPSEVNSVYYMEAFEKELQANGMEIVSKAAPTSADLTNAAQALANSDISVFAQISDNASGAGFAAIAKACERAQKPLFSFVAKQSVSGGAILSVSKDFVQCGRDSAILTARILKGESPEHIPYDGVSKTVISANMENAKKYNLSIPQSILDMADQVISKE